MNRNPHRRKSRVLSGCLQLPFSKLIFRPFPLHLLDLESGVTNRLMFYKVKLLQGKICMSSKRIVESEIFLA